MDARETADAVGTLFPELFHFLYRRRDPRAPAPTPELLLMLRHLAAAGPLTVKEAAAHFDRSQSSISERLERLVRRGLLERMPDERDRRQHLMWLTAQGRELLEEESRVLDPDRLAAAAARMSSEDRDALTTGLRALVRACATNQEPRGDDS